MSEYEVELDEEITRMYTRPQTQPLQSEDDSVYDSPLPSTACSIDPVLQTVSPPAVKPPPPLKSTTKKDKWKFTSATLLLILIVLNIIIMGFLIAMVFIKLPYEANDATQAGNTTSNCQEANRQEASVFQQREEMVNTNSTSRLLENLTREMAMLTATVQRNEGTVNQTKINIDNIQQTMNTTLPAMKKTADQTKKIVENVSEAVNILLESDSCLIENNASKKNDNVSVNHNSCQEIKEAYPASTSGYYTINGEEVYCGMDLCGTNKGWKRLAYLDMNDTTVDCPSGLGYYESGSVRACGRPTSSGGSCASLKFPSNGTSYSEVCGRVVGYQYGGNTGLTPAIHIHTSIDTYYVDGVSITSGNPRTHVWTMIAETRETVSVCPCSPGYIGDPPIPSLEFIGSDYFCESGNSASSFVYQLYVTDPLWDGMQCNNKEANCCLPSGPPWFHKTINTTSDYLELRVCGNKATAQTNTPVSFYEIYVN